MVVALEAACRPGVRKQWFLPTGNKYLGYLIPLSEAHQRFGHVVPLQDSRFNAHIAGEIQMPFYDLPIRSRL